MHYQPTILYYIELYKKHRIVMSFLIIAAALFAAAKASREPRVYKSVVSMLAMENERQLSFLEEAMGFEGGGISRDVVDFILTSRRMKEDIDSHFGLAGRPGAWWSLKPFITRGGFGISVLGSDPELTKEVADFSVENLGRLNEELHITSDKTMIRVMDHAARGVLLRRPVLKKSAFGGMFAFLVYSLYIFAADYLRTLRQ